MRTPKACETSSAEARGRSVILGLVAIASMIAVSIPGSTGRAAGPTRSIVSPADGAVIPNGPSVVVQAIAGLGPIGTVPQITIVSPKSGDRTGHGIEVSYRIANFTLVEPVGQPNAPNGGHVQLLVNDRVVMEVSQYEPVLVVSLPEGDITITARLVNNDGSPLNPDASSTIPIYVVASSAVTLPLVSNGGIALLLAFMLVVLILRRRKAAARNAKASGGKRP